jgi:hypothetical protein
MNETIELELTDLNLDLSDLEIMELQTEDALGIPDLGASSASVLSCSSLCCVVVV